MDKHCHFLPAVFVSGLTAFATPFPTPTYAQQITPQNVQMLAKAWSTEIADNGQQETSPIIWRGTMYLSTPHESVLALNAATGKS